MKQRNRLSDQAIWDRSRGSSATNKKEKQMIRAALVVLFFFALVSPAISRAQETVQQGGLFMQEVNSYCTTDGHQCEIGFFRPYLELNQIVFLGDCKSDFVVPGNIQIPGLKAEISVLLASPQEQKAGMVRRLQSQPVELTDVCWAIFTLNENVSEPSIDVPLTGALISGEATISPEGSITTIEVRMDNIPSGVLDVKILRGNCISGDEISDLGQLDDQGYLSTTSYLTSDGLSGNLVVITSGGETIACGEIQVPKG